MIFTGSALTTDSFITLEVPRNRIAPWSFHLPKIFTNTTLETISILITLIAINRTYSTFCWSCKSVSWYTIYTRVTRFASFTILSHRWTWRTRSTIEESIRGTLSNANCGENTIRILKWNYIDCLFNVFELEERCWLFVSLIKIFVILVSKEIHHPSKTMKTVLTWISISKNTYFYSQIYRWIMQSAPIPDCFHKSNTFFINYFTDQQYIQLYCLIIRIIDQLCH